MRQGKLTITAFIILMTLLLVLPGALRAENEAERVPLEKLVPKTTLAYASVPDVKAFASAAKKSFLYSLWVNESMRKAFAPLYREFDRNIEHINKSMASIGIELKLEDALDTFGGQASIALLKIKKDMPVFAIQIDVTANADKLQKAIKIVLDDANNDPAEKLKAEISDRGGQPVYKLKPKHAPFSIFAGFCRGSILITNDEKTFNSLLTSAEAGGMKDSLADDETYKKVKASVLKDGTPLSIMYCDLEGTINQVVTLAESQSAIDETHKKLALSITRYAKRLGMGSVASGDLFIDRSFLYSPEEIKIPGILMSPVSYKSAALAPAESIFYGSITVDPKAFIEWALKTTDEFNEEARPHVEAAFAHMKETFGFDMLEDVAGSISGEVGMFVSPPPMGGFIPRGALFIEIKDKEKLKSCITKMKAYTAAWAQEQKMELDNFLEETNMKNGETIYTFPILSNKLGEMIPDKLLLQPDPACGIIGDFFVIAMDSQVMKSIAARKTETSLANSPALAAAKKQFLPGSSAVGFMDVPALALTLYEKGIMLLRSETGDRFKLTELPMAEKFAANFKPVYCSCALTDEGVIGQHVSNLGPCNAFPLIAPVVAAAAIPNILASKRKASEIAVIYTLKNLSMAQEQYKMSNGAYATLKELVEKDYIDMELGLGEKYGYAFRIKNSGPGQWECTAVPVKPGAGACAYFVDETGVIRYTPGGSTPDRESPEYEE